MGPDPNNRKSGKGGGSSSANWWTPLFGWSSKPDYIDSRNSNNKKQIKSEKLEMELDLARTRTRFTPMMTKETKSFHDKMYHSAIASHNPTTDSHNPIIDFHNPTIDSTTQQPP
ncbi:hypothetical protein RGQ29_009327 [Quercus rubra]|uniref:Uncharacterized protein n=1 Tax=Quercus rubra TaxID=3512 RepID=A0AAN7FY39_QUERU|nr:hypothetical protein RGQ29_009327 [Quercus rubra]